MTPDSASQPDQHPSDGHIVASPASGKQLNACKDLAAVSCSSSPSTGGDVSPQSCNGDAHSNNGDAQVYIPNSGASRSIYSLYSPRRRNIILLAAAFVSILVPFSDTIYLPALAVSDRMAGSGEGLGARFLPQLTARQCAFLASCH